MRPAPVKTVDNQVFWNAALEGRLVAPRCSGCGLLMHPPRPMCPRCHSTDLRPQDLSGRGEVYSYSLLHHPQMGAFEYPVIAVLVDLEEGVRVLSNLVGIDAADVRIGLPVQVTFMPAADDTRVPVFELREQDR